MIIDRELWAKIKIVFQYEMSCKQSAACLTNKKSNGWGVNGACSFTGRKLYYCYRFQMSLESSATCRQCCVGPDCIEYYRKFSDPGMFLTIPLLFIFRQMFTAPSGNGMPQLLKNLSQLSFDL